MEWVPALARDITTTLTEATATRDLAVAMVATTTSPVAAGVVTTIKCLFSLIASKEIVDGEVDELVMRRGLYRVLEGNSIARICKGVIGWSIGMAFSHSGRICVVLCVYAYGFSTRLWHEKDINFQPLKAD
jgi:hypothetical protein